jgi:hypothetical protein
MAIARKAISDVYVFATAALGLSFEITHWFVSRRSD